MDLTKASEEDLMVELRRRGLIPDCPCRRWQVYIGIYDADGKTWRCRGCLRAIAKCTCR